MPLRGGRNARPVSPGPSGPTRGQGGAPAGRRLPPRAVPGGRRRRPRRNELDAGCSRAGWYFPPGEGIGRTRPGAGSRPRRGRFKPQDRLRRAIVAQFLVHLLHAPRRFPGTAAAPWMGPSRGPLIPPLMGPSTPPLMGPSGGEGAVRAGLGLFALVRRSATLRRSPSGRFKARGWASFVGPPRAK